MSVHLFGIRHHGPGSARALEQALHELQPDCILVEGPPEGDAVLALAADSELKLPVALLVYPPEAPNLGVFYPFAEFSPEWRAIRHAQDHGVKIQFMDLPQTHEFAARMEHAAKAQTDTVANAEAEKIPAQAEAKSATPAADSAPKEEQEPDQEQESDGDRFDPLAALSHAAGFADDEQWWEQQDRKSVV